MSKEDSDFRTSKRITFATDSWGGEPVTHLEIQWGGSTLMMDIAEEKIHLVGPCFKVTQESVNACDIALNSSHRSTEGEA
jgi:hypothetical protein